MWKSKYKGKVLLLALSSLSFIANSAPNESAIWFEKTDLSLDSRYRTVLLENGLRVITVDNDGPRNSMSIRMFIDAGSFQDLDDESGLAHFLEHMAFNGSTNVAEGEMISMLERHGLAFGADTNATTDMTNTSYRLDLPNANKDSINTALFLLRETASELDLDQGAIDRERKVIISEVRERQSADFDRHLDALDYIFSGTNLSRKIGLGTIKGMKKVTQKSLRNFYNTYYAPRNTTLILVGDVSHEVMLEYVKHHFSSWENLNFQPAVDPLLNLVLPSKPEAKAFVHPSSETRIELNFLENEAHRTWTKEEVVEYWLHLLGQMALDYRMANLSYDVNGRITSPSTHVKKVLGFMRLNQIAVTTATDDWQFGLTTIEQTLRQAAEYGFTPVEIQRQRESLINGLKDTTETERNASNYALADSAIDAIDDQRILVSSEMNFLNLSNAHHRLTDEAVNEAFRTRWASNPPRIYLTSPSAKNNLEQEMLSVYATSQKKKLDPFVDKAVTQFAYNEFGKPGKAQLVGTSSNTGIASYQFENGVMLNVKQTPYEENVVYLSVRVGNGKMSLTEAQYPLIQLYDGAMSTAGLKSHDMNDLRRIFAGTSIGLNSSVATTAFNSQQRVKKEDTFNQLKLITALMVDGGYREEAKLFLLQSMSNYLYSYQENPEAVLDFNIQAKLRGGDLRWAVPSIKELQAVSMRDLKSIVDNAVLNGPIEIAMVGDISQEEAINYVAQTFGALDIKANTAAVSNQVQFPQIKKEELTWYHKGEQNTAIASGYWSIPDARNTKQTVHFLLLETVLQQRLNREIREATGAAYSPLVSRLQSYDFENFGVINLKSNTTVDQVDEVFSAYKRVLKSLQSELITADELKRAVTPLVDSIKHEVNNNNHLFNLASIAQTSPELIAATQMRVQILKAATEQDILDTAKLIDIDNALQVKILPKK